MVNALGSFYFETIYFIKKSLPLIYLTLNLLTSAASSAMLSLLRWVI